MPRYERVFHTQLHKFKGREVILVVSDDPDPYRGKLAEVMSDYVVLTTGDGINSHAEWLVPIQHIVAIRGHGDG